MNENEYRLGIFSIVGFGAVRTLETADGKMFFSGMDVAEALGYSDLRKALADYCEEKGITKYDTIKESGYKELTYIDEDNMHRLFVHSKLPNAEHFESWVFDKVLPMHREIKKRDKFTIRKEN